MATGSSLHQCSVKWYNKCYMCSAPLDFIAIISEDKLKAFYTYSKFKPIDFTYNISCRKIIGLNLRNLCLKCYCFKKIKMIPGPVQLAQRECTGKSNMFKFKRNLLSESEVYKWIKGFFEFSERPDLEEYLIRTRRYVIPGLSVIIWTKRSYIYS